MLSTTKGDMPANMKFDGAKERFASWKDLIIGHLRQLGSQRTVAALEADWEPPIVSYEEMLYKTASVPELGESASADDKKRHVLQKAMISQQDLYIKNLLNQCLPAKYHEHLMVSLNDQKLPTTWAQLEADYGQNNAQGMMEMLQEYGTALAMDFKLVSHLFQTLKGICNRVNRQAFEQMKIRLIPSQLMMVQILRLLPSHIWSSSVSFDPQEFTVEKLAKEHLW